MNEESRDNLKRPAINGRPDGAKPSRVGDEAVFLRRVLGNLDKGTPQSVQEAKNAIDARLRFILVRTGRSGK